MTVEEKEMSLDFMCQDYKGSCVSCPCHNMNACVLIPQQITESDINEAYQTMNKFMAKQRQRN